MESSRSPNRLKKFRRINGYSQKKVARLLGFRDTSTISRWERGNAMPSIIQALRLSRIYHTLPHELYGDLWNTIVSDRSLLTLEESDISQ